MVDIKFCYGDEIEIIEQEHQYCLVRLSDAQYEELTSAEIYIHRA